MTQNGATRDKQSMNKIGIFFGTDSGTTRLIAKKIARKLGNDIVSKPLNINRIGIDDFLSYHAMILGTPTYGEGILPGISSGIEAGSWEEFLPQLAEHDLSGKTIALYGLGDQEKYAPFFVDALYELYLPLKNCGANIIGDWSIDGYAFEASKAILNDRFVGLAIDHHIQNTLTDSRLDAWLEFVSPKLQAHIEQQLN